MATTSAGLRTTAAASKVTSDGGGAPTAAVVDCHTLGRNRRPPLVRTMFCRSDRLSGRGGGGGGGVLFKEEIGHAKWQEDEEVSHRAKFRALCEISRIGQNFAQAAVFRASGSPPAVLFP